MFLLWFNSYHSLQSLSFPNEFFIAQDGLLITINYQTEVDLFWVVQALHIGIVSTFRTISSITKPCVSNLNEHVVCIMPTSIKARVDLLVELKFVKEVFGNAYLHVFHGCR